MRRESGLYSNRQFFFTGLINEKFLPQPFQFLAGWHNCRIRFSNRNQCHVVNLGQITCGCQDSPFCAVVRRKWIGRRYHQYAQEHQPLWRKGAFCLRDRSHSGPTPRVSLFNPRGNPPWLTRFFGGPPGGQEAIQPDRLQGNDLPMELERQWVPRAS